MPQYLSPGVYVEEIPSSVKPIVGVSTTTAAFVGFYPDDIDIPAPNPDWDPNSNDPKIKDPAIHYHFHPVTDDDNRAADDAERAARAAEAAGRATPSDRSLAATARQRRSDAFFAARQRDMNKAAAKSGEVKLCTTFADFRRYFGDFSNNRDQNNLAHGVYGFFDNGGSRCYVLRYSALDMLQGADGLTPLEAVDEISMVAAPGITDDVVQENIIDHCENMSDRFAILDPPEAVQDDQLTKENIQGKVRDSDYAAYYFPQIQVFDMPTKLKDPNNPDNKGLIWIGPSGHIAGVYARVDNTRGVHKAPANEVIRGALDLRYLISKNIQDGLNPGGINAIRNLNGDIRIWGARTVGGDLNTDFKYINVRRLFIFLRKSIDQGTQWVVFEPNDRNLWAKIALNVTAFLTNVWHDGALFGSTAAEAFYVKCDDETNPPEVRDIGQVVTEIGVAPVEPAEFVIFRITQWTGTAAKAAGGSSGSSASAGATGSSGSSGAASK
jgi:uncharacterized protein